MKNFITLVILCLLFCGSIFAQNNTNTVSLGTSTTTSEEKLKEAKKLLQEAHQQEEAENPSNSNSSSKSKTNGWDILDKSLDKLTSFTSSLEGVIKSYAPEVWRIMLIQQYAKAIAYPLFWGLLLIGLGLVYKALRKFFGIEKGQAIFVDEDCEHNGKNHSYYSTHSDAYWARAWFAAIIPLILCIILSIVFLYSLTESIMVGINPEYYAIKDLIQLVK